MTTLAPCLKRVQEQIEKENMKKREKYIQEYNKRMDNIIKYAQKSNYLEFFKNQQFIVNNIIEDVDADGFSHILPINNKNMVGMELFIQAFKGKLSFFLVIYDYSTKFGKETLDFPFNDEPKLLESIFNIKPSEVEQEGDFNVIINTIRKLTTDKIADKLQKELEEHIHDNFELYLAHIN